MDLTRSIPYKAGGELTYTAADPRRRGGIERALYRGTSLALTGKDGENKRFGGGGEGGTGLVGGVPGAVQELKS